jgi:hypothetical protein
VKFVKEGSFILGFLTENLVPRKVLILVKCTTLVRAMQMYRIALYVTVAVVDAVEDLR